VFWADEESAIAYYHLDPYLEDINPDDDLMTPHFESESLDEIEKFLDSLL
jgi:hypothetical protein